MKKLTLRFGNPALVHEFMEEEINKAGGVVTVNSLIEESKFGDMVFDFNEYEAYAFGYAFALWQVRVGNISRIGNLSLSVS